VICSAWVLFVLDPAVWSLLVIDWSRFPDLKNYNEWWHPPLSHSWKRWKKSIIWTGDHVGLASNIDGLIAVCKRERMESVVGCKLQLTYHVIVKLEGSFLQSCRIVIEFSIAFRWQLQFFWGSNSLKLTHLLHQLSMTLCGAICNEKSWGHHTLTSEVSQCFLAICIIILSHIFLSNCVY
jgi:hypothetical protein